MNRPRTATVVGLGFNCKTKYGDQQEDRCEESFHVAGDWHKGHPSDPDKTEFIL